MRYGKLANIGTMGSMGAASKETDLEKAARIYAETVARIEKRDRALAAKALRKKWAKMRRFVNKSVKKAANWSKKLERETKEFQNHKIRMVALARKTAMFVQNAERAQYDLELAIARESGESAPLAPPPTDLRIVAL